VRLPGPSRILEGFLSTVEPCAFLQTVASTNDDYHVCEAGVIGRRGSPLSRGRGASFLGRPGLALFETTELLELVVDAPCGDHVLRRWLPGLRKSSGSSGPARRQMDSALRGRLHRLTAARRGSHHRFEQGPAWTGSTAGGVSRNRWWVPAGARFDSVSARTSEC
jgi:hypothetical protein